MQVGDHYVTEDGMAMEVIEIREDDGGGRTIISRSVEGLN